MSSCSYSEYSAFVLALYLFIADVGRVALHDPAPTIFQVGYCSVSTRSDTVFGIKNGLIVDYRWCEDVELARKHNVVL